MLKKKLKKQKNLITFYKNNLINTLIISDEDTLKKYKQICKKY